MTYYDYVVVGCGTMGSMALWQLTETAPEGSTILGVEQFGRVHTKGSYAGESRLFRLIMKEGGQYVGLARRARQLWLELNEKSGRDVFIPTGALSIGTPEIPAMDVLDDVIAEHGLDSEKLDSEQLAERFPQFHQHEGDRGILDPMGGAIRPEVAVAMAQNLALDNGAELWDHTTVLAIDRANNGDNGDSGDSGFVISTDKGTVRAGTVIATAGSWSAHLCPELADYVRVKGIPLNWYMPNHIDEFTPDSLPVFIKDFIADDGRKVHVFGAPSLDGWSVKVSPLEQPYRYTTPEAVAPNDDDVDGYVADMSEAVTSMIPSTVRTSMHHDGFTATGAPIVDVSPSTGAIVAAGMSGRGMKFAPIYGRLLAEMAVDGHSELQLPEFTLAEHVDVERADSIVRL
ncbi:FAD-dependent oxidoreductase [Corynebacterium falsenii]|uniref:FAD-dependent oxidoreductase n=1 Tax=Corynebacterium falsenii TaxID=108486 RepID=UPI003FCF148F